MKIAIALALAALTSVASAKGLTEAWRVGNACSLDPMRTATAVYTLVDTTLRTIDPASGAVKTTKLDGMKVGMLFGAAEPNIVMKVGEQYYGLAIADGAERWHRVFAGALMVPGATEMIGARIEAGALVVERVDAVSGAVRWAAKAPLDKGALKIGLLATDGARIAIPIVVDGKRAVIVALDAKTGAVAWQKPFAWRSDVAPQPAGETIVAADQQVFHFLSAADGRELGTLPHAELTSDLWVAPDGKRVFTSEPTRVFALDVAKRKAAWSVAWPNEQDTPVIVRSTANAPARIAVMDDAHGLRVVSMADGAILASYGILKPSTEALFGGAGDDGAIACDRRDLIALRPDPKAADVKAAITGHFACDKCVEAWEFKLGTLRGTIDRKTWNFGGTLVGRGRFELFVRRSGDPNWDLLDAFVDTADPKTFALGTVALPARR